MNTRQIKASTVEMSVPRTNIRDQNRDWVRGIHGIVPDQRDPQTPVIAVTIVTAQDRVSRIASVRGDHTYQHVCESGLCHLIGLKGMCATQRTKGAMRRNGVQTFGINSNRL